MKQGLGKIGRILAGFYAAALLVEVLADACFIQPNTLAVVVNDVFHVPLLISGIVIAGLSLVLVLSDEVRKIGAFCEKMIPPMIVVFMIGTLVTIGANLPQVPHAFEKILQYAFAPAPAVGGFVGSSVRLTMARGAARGFSRTKQAWGRRRPCTPRQRRIIRSIRGCTGFSRSSSKRSSSVP